METDPACEREIYDPYCRWPAGSATLMRSAPWRRLVVLGDSVAAGIRGPLDGYRDLDAAARVAEALGAAHPSFSYHNLAERDLRTAEIRDRQLRPALELHPDLAVISAEGNDALRRSFDEERFHDELTSIIRPLVAQGTQFVTIGLFDLARSGLVPDPHAGPMAERFDRLDALTSRITDEYGGVHVGNHGHPLAADPGIFADDRIHCNARGHAIAAANLVTALAALPAKRTPDAERPAGVTPSTVTG
ncbi:SGNH/GDSL hydrolase family protein [Streptosporangium sp. 'caverna']|uniref:SGNH/GDSL hydrolase family protein n=1 Tax=Streptosporangium sp. 'caverna' TaxID=2202249 RepID=UPI000D7DFEF2|nr:SGNH/GDSL hydrolase family protein [Streptosporangium sp. 'caverna']AWS43400.1 GDSL family lipase [Streptosporangium sp. 'caverna']